MKKIFATLLLALTTMAASAQDNPNRLIIQPKQGNPSGYLVERLDSVYFTKINGRVAADINLQGYTTGTTGDTLRLAVTKTPECQAYMIACLPASVANALTSDAVVAQYFDLYVGGDKFTEDFTNAVMTNMGIEFKPNSDYSVITMGYDKYGIACASSRVDFTTPAANIIGNPTVTYKVLEANYEDFTIDFQPNEDCLGFYACAFEKGTAKAQYEQWGAMMGFANMGDMIKQWGGTMFADRETHTWKQMTPGTDYEVYVLPIDENQNYGTMVIVPVTTKKYGGAGQATVTITLGEFGSQEGKCYQYVTYTPNDQASFMRDMIIDKAVFQSSADWGMGSEEKILEYLKDDHDGADPNWNRYGVDVAQWGVDPNKEYIAYAIAQNINGEWGPLSKLEFTTGSAKVAPAKTFTVAKRLNGVSKKDNVFVPGKAPKLQKTTKRGLTLVGE